MFASPFICVPVGASQQLAFHPDYTVALVETVCAAAEFLGQDNSRDRPSTTSGCVVEARRETEFAISDPAQPDNPNRHLGVVLRALGRLRDYVPLLGAA
jgi:hypothetical protein